MVVSHYGDKDKAVSAMRVHFQNSSNTGAPQEVEALMRAMPDDDEEPPFTSDEVLLCLSRLKSGKATGMSHISQELLVEISRCSEGVDFLVSLMNSFLASPALLPSSLLRGWVLLIPKKLTSQMARDFRPIVLSEVLIKFLARLCTLRITQAYPEPRCGMGGFPGRQTAEALFIMKSMMGKSFSLGDSSVFLKLDIAGAYDSILIQEIIRLLCRRYSSRAAKSIRVICRILRSQTLTFGMLGEFWTLPMTRGVIQGGSHSPTLFSFLVSQTFDELSESWHAQLHKVAPFYIADGHPVWGIWFVDDAFCIFRNALQLRRLYPQLELCLQGMGLVISTEKCAILAG